jgi:trehalose synthase
VEGPARRHRRIPLGEGAVPRRPARARRLDGARRPEGWDFYNQTVAYAAGDPDIYILSNLNNVGSVEVNAFRCIPPPSCRSRSRRASASPSPRRSGRRVRPSRAASAASSPDPGRGDGWLVESSTECAEACVEVLRDPREARQRALHGKEYVRRHFLTPRLLRDWLVLFNQLLGNDTSGAEVAVVSATA